MRLEHWRMLVGNVFHNRGAETMKAREPNDWVLNIGSINSVVLSDDERRTILC